MVINYWVKIRKPVVSFHCECVLSVVFLDCLCKQKSYLILIFRKHLEMGWTMRWQGFDITTLLKVEKSCKRLSITKWVMKCQLMSNVNKYEAMHMPRQSQLQTQLIVLKTVVPHSWVNIWSHCEQHSEILSSSQQWERYIRCLEQNRNRERNITQLAHRL